MRIYILRHGQTDWNVARRWQGNQNTSLNKSGIKQAETVVNKILTYNISKIYSSPLNRARETAEIVRNKGNIKVDIEFVDGLKEVKLGDWEGLGYDEVEIKFKEDYKKWIKSNKEEIGHSVENFFDLQERSYKAFLDICENNEENVLLVGHGTWIRALMCKLLHIPLEHRNCFDIDNVSITTIEYENGKILVRTLNELIG